MDNRKELDVLLAIHSTPARRYLKSDPIPDETIRAILNAAIRGPSGGNQQGWGWIVVKDSEVKQKIQKFYLEGWELAYGYQKDEILNSTVQDGLGKRNFLSAEHLANNLAEAPVWIIPVLKNVSQSPRAGSSIYGAVQNLMLAARSFGIGSTLTTLYSAYEEEVKMILGLPSEYTTMALIPLGYPSKGRWSQPKRQPIEEVTHWGKWGQLHPKNT